MFVFKRALRAPIKGGALIALARQLKLVDIETGLFEFSHAKSDNKYLYRFVFLRMDIAESQLVVKMSALFKTRENADVSLICEGKTVLAHSTILELR